MNPSSQQKQALTLIESWINCPAKQKFTLGGYAGSGKTSLINTIKYMLHGKSAVVTYTNKAASVLRDKEIHAATTIHKLMYKPVESDEGLHWVRNNSLDVDVVIVDEASMLGQNIRDDLESYGVPVLYVGDPFQLPPVNEDSVMDHCDFILTEVHRHGDKILETATAIREGKPYHDVDQYSLTDSDLSDADIVICLSNARRYTLNQRIRKHRGFIGKPQTGDRIVSAKTDYDCGIFAGELGTLVSTNNHRRYEVLFDGWDDTAVFTNGYFLGPKDNPYSLDLRGRSCLDYGYAITCHKAQGSQYNNVIVWEEHRSDARWMYTAATRAISKLVMAGK
jgi:exodeoxyribonuclease-5